jgi:hypothetical protein
VRRTSTTLAYATWRQKFMARVHPTVIDFGCREDCILSDRCSPHDWPPTSRLPTMTCMLVAWVTGITRRRIQWVKSGACAIASATPAGALDAVVRPWTIGAAEGRTHQCRVTVSGEVDHSVSSEPRPAGRALIQQRSLRQCRGPALGDLIVVKQAGWCRRECAHAVARRRARQRFARRRPRPLRRAPGRG